MLTEKYRRESSANRLVGEVTRLINVFKIPLENYRRARIRARQRSRAWRNGLSTCLFGAFRSPLIPPFELRDPVRQHGVSFCPHSGPLTCRLSLDDPDTGMLTLQNLRYQFENDSEDDEMENEMYVSFLGLPFHFGTIFCVARHVRTARSIFLSHFVPLTHPFTCKRYRYGNADLVNQTAITILML